MVGGAMLPKNVKNCTADELKAENQTVYDQVYDLGRQSAAAEISRLKAEGTIRKNAYRLNLADFGESLITEGKSLDVALEALIEESSKVKSEEITFEKKEEKNELQGVFERTAPNAAGAGSDGDTKAAPKTKEEAVEIYKKEGLSLSEATKRARRNFTSLFVPQE